MLDNLTRHARAAGRLAAANFARLNTPLKVNWCLTYWCQYRCKTCNIWLRKPQDELSTEEALAFVRNNRDIAWVDLTGGEIFLRKDVGEILEAIVTTWPDLVLLHFPTNGFQTDTIVRTVERVASRYRSGQFVVTVSVDGDEAVNDDVRGIKGGFQRQLATARALRRVPGVKVVLGMTISAWNTGRVEETFNACAQACPGLTFDEFHVNVAQVSAHYYDNASTLAQASSASVAGDLAFYRRARGVPRSFSAWVEHRYLHHLEAFLQTRRTPMRCHSLRSSCFVDPWGTVFPCVTYTRPLGSLRDHDMALGPIWSAPTTASVQTEIWAGECPQCWTACEAYQSVLGNLLRPWDRATPPRAVRSGEAVPESRP